jgi:SNF2 family DNA or RNA helicase
MTKKTFGDLFFDHDEKKWIIAKAEPHVCMKAKQIFSKIPKSATTFDFPDTPGSCTDLKWFTDRYPLKISDTDLKKLLYQKKKYDKSLIEREAIFIPGYQPHPIELKPGKHTRNYQSTAKDFFEIVERMLLADDLGLGKSLTALLPCLSKKKPKLPALVVCPTHIADQWKTEAIEEYTNLKAVILSGHKVYDFPEADIYIIRYSCLAKWIHNLLAIDLKYIIFDECQELRRDASQKYDAARTLSENVQYCMGLTATPTYNLGGEIYNVMDVLYPGCLSDRYDFAREWMEGGSFYGYKNKANALKNPDAAGAYLRQEGLMLRRTRSEVGMELPEINKLVYTVEFDQHAIDQEEKLCRQLAMDVLYAEDVEERGHASGQLDIRMRQVTGIAKAKGVAAFVKMMIDNGDAVLLGGWHHEVYRIWEKEFLGYNPVWYTGRQSPKQKNEAKKDFIEGRTKLMIMSNRSGAGTDGLQKVCNTIVHGELDYSPQIHAQFAGRIDRPGQQNLVTEIFLNTEYGSDPGIIATLGVKSSQSHGILNPAKTPIGNYSNHDRIKEMAKKILEKHKK